MFGAGLAQDLYKRFGKLHDIPSEDGLFRRLIRPQLL
jgi:hypothetical protein